MFMLKLVAWSIVVVAILVAYWSAWFRRGWRKRREYILGLGSTEVEGGSLATISVPSQVNFRPDRLVIPSNLAADFLITDIKVDKNSQLVSTGALPAVMFTDTAFDVRLKMDLVAAGMFVSVTVVNQAKEPRTFVVGVVGTVVEKWWSFRY
jgi:hypothetical protein